MRPMVPARVPRLTDKVMNTYGAFVDHAVKCEECRETGGRCEQAERLWGHYRNARKEARVS